MSRHRRKSGSDDAAFTLTEMAASLVVAAMLVGGLGELTRQFARTTVRVRAALEESRGARIAEAELQALERADPGTLHVTPGAVTAQVGGREMRVDLAGMGRGDAVALVLSWGGEAPARRIASVAPGARFELGSDGAVRLWKGEGEPPVLVVTPARGAPFDCQFDVVKRDCR